MFIGFCGLREGRRRSRFPVACVLTALLAVSLIVTGCGNAERGAGHADGSYGNDGYMGISNSNPSLPITGTAWSYRRDNAFVAELLRGIDGIRHIRITRTGGSDMRVHLDLDKSLGREEAERIAARAEAVLKENFPRYRVTVDTDRK